LYATDASSIVKFDHNTKTGQLKFTLACAVKLNILTNCNIFLISIAFKFYIHQDNTSVANAR